ncbi:MAG TPA: condensation domain-containing protein, partial [Pyrinomonadaceae bacterium]|nr:condensation domain-containing protein [Pyrinomonadaceae bacterium]
MSEPKDFLNATELDADRLELFEYLLEEEGVGGAPPSDRISPRGRAERLPLSFAQQRLWFLEQLEPGSPAYHIAGALRMVGRLDASALGRSLNEIVRRHESLRTSFVAAAGRPEQVVSPDCRVALPVEDLTALSSAERESEMRRLSREQAQRPFDLSQSPLMRALLLRLNDDEHVLLLTMHHIVSDGWSSGVMVRELTALYEAYRKGADSPLEELGVQYADYALWQREHVAGEALETQLDYWRRQLGGDLPVLELPTLRARASVQTFRAAAHARALPPKLSEELKGLSLGEDATLFMTLLAALQVLLSRYSGQTDLLVGTPVAGRTRAETEALIGCFVNTLVLRARIDERESFRDLLARVKEVCLGAYAHQDVPFEKLVEELQPER